MVKVCRSPLLYAPSWEFWRLVAAIFTISFIIQILLFLTVAQVSQISVCYSKLSSVNQYGVEGSFEPTIRILDGPAPASELDIPTCVSSVSYTITNGSGSVTYTNPFQNCTCPRSEVPAKPERSKDKETTGSSVRALQPLSFPLYPFVKFNIYRISPSSFYVVGISSAVARAFDVPVQDCQWQKKGEKNSIVTPANMMYIKWDENRMPYVPAVVNCTFDSPVGEDGNGGTLRLSVSIKPKRDSPSGLLTVDVHKEQKKEFQKFNQSLTKWEESGVASLPYKFAFCGPPMHGRIKIDWIVSWLTYHYQLYEGNEGKVRFFFYNTGGLNDEGKKVLEPFLKAGVLEIIDVLDEWTYPAHYHNQLLFINDCLQRTRYIAQWTLFHDFDEFLYIPAPNSLSSLLEQHKDRPWLTFASLPASYSHCLEPSETKKVLWPVEKMLWVEKQPECRYSNGADPYVCTGPLGRRKYVVNPRKVLATGVHVVTIDTERGGIDLNGTIARVHHYHGALATYNYLCGKTFNSSVLAADDSKNVENYVFDDSIAREAAKARELIAPLLGEISVW